MLGRQGQVRSGMPPPLTSRLLPPCLATVSSRAGRAAGVQGRLLFPAAPCSVQRTPSSWSGLPTWRSTMKMSGTCWAQTPSRSWRWVGCSPGRGRWGCWRRYGEGSPGPASLPNPAKMGKAGLIPRGAQRDQVTCQDWTARWLARLDQVWDLWARLGYVSYPGL